MSLTANPVTAFPAVTIPGIIKAAMVSSILNTLVVSTIADELPASYQSSGEANLVSALLGKYKNQPGAYLARPVVNSSHTMHVNFSLVLVQILDFDEMNHKLYTLVWKKYVWHDETLRWNPARYDGVKMIVLPADKVWTPDIILYNNVGSSAVENHSNVVMLSVTHDGTVFWSPPVKYESSCAVDMTDYPFDIQVCELRFGSWSYDATQLDIWFTSGFQGLELHQYNPSSEWDLMDDHARKNSIKYPCCTNPFSDLTFRVQLKRRITFHMRLFLVPTPILSLLSLAIFWIPPNRPDRTAFGLSLFSSFFLLLILVVNSTPPTSTATIGRFYIAILKIVFLTVVFSITSINCIHATRRMPVWMDKVFLRFFGFLVCGRSCEYRKARTYEPTLKAEKIPPDVALNQKKWRSLAMILDRIYFIAFIPLLICAFLFLFPHPDQLFKLLSAS